MGVTVGGLGRGRFISLWCATLQIWSAPFLGLPRSDIFGSELFGFFSVSRQPSQKYTQKNMRSQKSPKKSDLSLLHRKCLKPHTSISMVLLQGQSDKPFSDFYALYYNTVIDYITNSVNLLACINLLELVFEVILVLVVAIVRQRLCL